MLVSDSKEFIFIHVYKTGGKSIRTALRPYRDRPSLLQRALQKLNLITLPTHASALEVREKWPRKWSAYFTFAFVRNPWSWQVSLYHYMSQQSSHKQHDVVTCFNSFEQYLDWRIDGHVHLQQEYLTDESGTLLVDYVGRLETMREDFQTICERIGVEANLPHKNKSSHDDYRNYYNDRTRDLVAQHYTADIDRFGYSFDGIGQKTIND